MTIAAAPKVKVKKITIKNFDIKEFIRLLDKWIYSVSDKLRYREIGFSCGLSPDRVKQIVLKMRQKRWERDFRDRGIN